MARGGQRKIGRIDEAGGRRAARARRAAIGIIEGDRTRDGDGAGVQLRSGGIEIIIDRAGVRARDRQRPRDDARGIVTHGDIVGQRRGGRAGVAHHGDRPGLVDVIVGTEEDVPADDVIRDITCLADARTRLVGVVADDRQVAASSPEGERAEARRDARAIGRARDRQHLAADQSRRDDAAAGVRGAGDGHRAGLRRTAGRIDDG